MENTMEQMEKDHYYAFYKHLLVCNPSFGVEFLHESSYIKYTFITIPIWTWNVHKKTTYVYVYFCQNERKVT